MRVLFGTLILLFLFDSCSDKGKNDASSFLDERSLIAIKPFFENIESGKYEIAARDLLKSNENIDLNDSSTINLIRKFIELNQTSGRFVSYKILRKKTFQNDIGVYCYLAKYEKKFYRFTFVFYNNEKEVKIFKFSFDDNIDAELEEGTKLFLN